MIFIQFIIISFQIVVQLTECLENPPELECLESGMRLHFVPEPKLVNDQQTNATRPFCGHIYVKGFFFSSRCHLDYTGFLIAEPFFFHIPYRSDCQIRRERILQNSFNGQNLTAGITYSTVIIVQHHKLFVTDRDKAYSISCFYKDGRNVFEQSIQVGDLSTEQIEGADGTPTCRYEVLSGGVNGQPVKFANIGDQLIHKWTCDSEGMGMLVHSCYVRDGVGSEFALLDDRGCVTDTSLLQPLTYSAQMNFSYTPISAFKFADQMVVYFSCQITLCNKRDNGCEGITPPTCQYTPLPSEGGPSIPVNNSSDAHRARDSSGGLIFSSSVTAGTPTRSFLPVTSSSTRSQPQFSSDPTSQLNPNHRPFSQTSYSDENYSPYGSNVNENLRNEQNGQNRYHYESTNTYANQNYSNKNTKPSASGVNPTSTTTKAAASGIDQSKVYSSSELLGKSPTAYNIFRAGSNVAAARHARDITHIPTFTAIKFHPKNNDSKSVNASKMIVDVAAERLIIFTKDEGLDDRTQRLMAGSKDCNFQQSLDSLWTGILFVVIIFGISALVLQRTYYQRQFNQYTSNSSSTAFGSPFELSGFCRMTSTDTAHNSPSLTRLQNRC